jgi:hypothetical protein
VGFQNELLDKNVNSMVHSDDVKYFDYFLEILSSDSCKKWFDRDIKNRTQSFNCRLLVKPGTDYLYCFSNTVLQTLHFICM